MAVVDPKQAIIAAVEAAELVLMTQAGAAYAPYSDAIARDGSDLVLFGPQLTLES